MGEPPSIPETRAFVSGLTVVDRDVAKIGTTQRLWYGGLFGQDALNRFLSLLQFGDNRRLRSRNAGLFFRGAPGAASCPTSCGSGPPPSAGASPFRSSR